MSSICTREGGRGKKCGKLVEEVDFARVGGSSLPSPFRGGTEGRVRSRFLRLLYEIAEAFVHDVQEGFAFQITAEGFNEYVTLVVPAFC